MPDKLKMFPLLTDRWLAGTRHMTYEERGMYLDLLLYQFTENRPIKDAKHAAKLLHLTGHSSRKCHAILIDKFIKNQHGFTHPFVTRLLHNKGRIKGLDPGAYTVAEGGAEGGGFSAQEKEKEIKEKNTKKKALPPDDWQPNLKTRDWFAKQGFNFSIEDMTQEFIDGCKSKGYKYLDFEATFKNWSKKRKTNNPRQHEEKKADWWKPTPGGHVV